MRIFPVLFLREFPLKSTEAQSGASYLRPYRKDRKDPRERYVQHLQYGCWYGRVVDKNDADKAVEAVRNAGEEAYVMGELVKSDEGVIIC